MEIKKFFIVVLLLLGSGLSAFAQNPANYKVDELSDAKIRELMFKAESIGYTDAQLEQMAMAQGMKPDEILKLRKRVELIRQQDGTKGKQAPVPLTQGDGVQDKPGRRLNYEPDTVESVMDLKEKEMKDAFEDLKPKIFGKELFKNSKITFEPDLRLATPRNYVFGPDDEVLIDISGVSDLQKPYSLKVSPEGVIRIPMVGPVNVGGLTVDRARDRIRAAMLPYYPSLRSGNTQLNITLGNIRSISVTLNGQVVKSGTFTLPSLATVFNALHASGGPNDNGSFRKIQLIRNGEVVSTIDVYKFLLSGVQQGNIQLRDRDVINIPFYTTRVEVTGEAKVPGLYELLPGEKFNDVLNFAGGFSQMAYTSKVKVFQNTDKERKILDIMEKDFGTYQPKNGDKFFLEPILERFENRVEIAGAVFRPAFYSLEPGLTISGLIGKAEGIKEDAFLSRAYIQRLAADNTATLIPFDLAKVLNGSATDIELQREDKVIISSIFDLREEYNVTIGGEVRLPATYRFAENMSLEDLIQMAGGFKEGATPGRVAIARRVRNSDGQSKEATTAEVFEVAVDKNLKLSGTPFLLQPFDIVTVRGAEGYEIQKQVFIEGEVRSPGPYTIISKNERISDLIKRAGGFTAFAYLDGASLKRPSLNKADVQGNAVDSEEQKTLRNLRRLQQNGADTTSIENLRDVFTSDLVGINLEKIMEKPLSRADLILEEGDVIRVPKQPQTVKVTGEVLNPNNIIFQVGKSFKQYVNSSGGFTFNAYKRGVHIKYANGSSEAAKKFLFFNNYPIVKPGAEIVVPRRAVREPIKTQEIIGISTGIASIAALLITILR